MNGPDESTKRPPNGDDESWALPEPEPQSPPQSASQPEPKRPPSHEPKRPPRRSRFATGLLAVVVGASVVVGSAALAFVAFSSGDEEEVGPPVPSASATAAQPGDAAAGDAEPGDAEPGAATDPADPADAADPAPTRGAGPAPEAGAEPAEPAPAPDDANAADLNLGGIEDCSMGPDTWRIISGDVGCPEATDVGIRYLSARDRGVGDGEGASVYIDDWSCSAPSAARSAELGAVAVCTRADGARVHQLS